MSSSTPRIGHLPDRFPSDSGVFFGRRAAIASSLPWNHQLLAWNFLTYKIPYWVTGLLFNYLRYQVPLPLCHIFASSRSSRAPPAQCSRASPFYWLDAVASSRWMWRSRPAPSAANAAPVSTTAKGTPAQCQLPKNSGIRPSVIGPNAART